MSEKTKTAPTEKGEGRKGGLKNARPEVQALARITGILDRMDDEQRSRTLDLVGQTYDRLGSSRIHAMAIDVTRMMEGMSNQLESEDRKLAALREENERLRQQLRGVLGVPAGSPMGHSPLLAEEHVKMDPGYVEAKHPNPFVKNPKSEAARVG